MGAYWKKYGNFFNNPAEIDIIAGIVKGAGSTSITFNTPKKVESFFLVDYTNSKGFVYRYDPKQPNKLLGTFNGTVNYGVVSVDVTITDNNVTIAPFTYSSASSTWYACVIYENVCTKIRLLEQEHCRKVITVSTARVAFDIPVEGYPEEVYIGIDNTGICVTNVSPVDGQIYDDRTWDLTYSGYTERRDYWIIRSQNRIQMNTSWSSTARTLYVYYSVRQSS